MSFRGFESAFNVIAHIHEHLLGICKGILLMLKIFTDISVSHGSDRLDTKLFR
jgi:hypothetical protein